MTVTIIIPNYNHSKFLKQRIESILNQTYRDYELIILDDCSTDNSRNIIDFFTEKHPLIRIYYNKTNSGNPFLQWNRGVSHANGEFVWIAESDDYAGYNFLEETVEVLKKNTHAGLVFSDSRIINEEKGIMYLASERKNEFSSQKLSKAFNMHSDKGKSMFLFFENPIVNVSSVLFRKSYYLEAGGADISMRFCGDWFLYLKIYLLSDINYIPEPLNNFRLHSGSGYKSHYVSNNILFEKMKIFHFILRHSKISLKIVFLCFMKTIKVILLRLIFYFRLNNVLRIEFPRVPHHKII